MAKPQQPIPPDMLAEPLARPKRLAERMARVLNDEDVSDVAVAMALLTSGVVSHYASNALGARRLICDIRTLEDQLLAKTFEVDDIKVQ